jgi:hypothetical protein
MSTNNEQIGSSETRTDRLATVLLIIGFLLASLSGTVSIIGLFAAGRIQPLFLLIVLLGVSGIFYGKFRTTRGSLATRHLFKTTLQKIRMGVLTGSAAGFCIAALSQIKDVNGSWVVAFLVLSIVWGLLLGIPFGGLGGLILGSIWKNKSSAYIGGVIAAAVVALYWYIFVLHLL